LDVDDSQIKPTQLNNYVSLVRMLGLWCKAPIDSCLFQYHFNPFQIQIPWLTNPNRSQFRLTFSFICLRNGSWKNVWKTKISNRKTFQTRPSERFAIYPLTIVWWPSADSWPKTSTAVNKANAKIGEKAESAGGKWLEIGGHFFTPQNESALAF